MNQFVGTVATAAVVSYVCTHTKFGKMVFSSVDEAIEHFAQLREWSRNKRRERRQKEKEKPIDVTPEEPKQESAENG